jgi:hypothetical protein
MCDGSVGASLPRLGISGEAGKISFHLSCATKFILLHCSLISSCPHPIDYVRNRLGWRDFKTPSVKILQRETSNKVLGSVSAQLLASVRVLHPRLTASLSAYSFLSNLYGFVNFDDTVADLDNETVVATFLVIMHVVIILHFVGVL